MAERLQGSANRSGDWESQAGFPTLVKRCKYIIYAWAEHDAGPTHCPRFEAQSDQWHIFCHTSDAALYQTGSNLGWMTCRRGRHIDCLAPGYDVADST